MIGWRWIVALTLGAHSAGSVAQTAVYESNDTTGPVSSGKPSPGASVAEQRS